MTFINLLIYEDVKWMVRMNFADFTEKIFFSIRQIPLWEILLTKIYSSCKKKVPIIKKGTKIICNKLFLKTFLGKSVLTHSS